MPWATKKPFAERAAELLKVPSQRVPQGVAGLYQDRSMSHCGVQDNHSQGFIGHDLSVVGEHFH